MEGHEATSRRPKSVWLHNFFATMFTDGRKWLQAVGEDFGRKLSQSGLRLSVTGP